jgi:AcrR family transcriptional regulator
MTKRNTDTPPPPTDLRLLRTRRALRDGLLSLIGTRPFDEITVRDITNKSLVGYNTFFRHYASKAELVEEIVREEIQQLFERALPAIVGADTRKVSLALCKYVSEHRQLWTALLGEGAAPALKRMLITYALDRNVRVPEHQWLPMDLGAIFGVGATLDILGWWLAKQDEYSAEKAAELLDRLVLSPALGRTSVWGMPEVAAVAKTRALKGGKHKSARVVRTARQGQR